MDAEPEVPKDACPQQNDPKALREKLLEEWRDSVVKIKTETGCGTGFFIDDKTIATNFHVIKGSRSFTAEDGRGNRYRLGAQVFGDAEHDLALLTIEGAKPSNVKPIRIAHVDEDHSGKRLFHLGHPLGQPLKLIEGTGKGHCDERNFYELTMKQVSPAKQNELKIMLGKPDNERWLKQPLTIIDAAGATHGSSGAPFLTEDGVAVAVVRKGIRNEEGTIYCAPSNYLQDLIDKSRRKDEINLPEDQFFARTGFYETGAEHYFKQLKSNPKGFVNDSIPLAIGGAGLGITLYKPWNEAIFNKTKGRLHPGAALGGLAVLPLAVKDLIGYNNAIDPLTQSKYEYALAADATMGTGFALKTVANAAFGKHPLVRLGRVGIAIAGTGAAGRLAAEFIPNEFSVDLPSVNNIRH